jgi:hypothetical protein
VRHADGRWLSSSSAYLAFRLVELLLPDIILGPAEAEAHPLKALRREDDELRRDDELLRDELLRDELLTRDWLWPLCTRYIGFERRGG